MQNDRTSTLKITVFTIFPDIIRDFCQKSLLGLALKKRLWDLDVINIRDYALDKHKKVDDTPCGGGQGMVMKPDVLGRALEDYLHRETTAVGERSKGSERSESSEDNKDYEDSGKSEKGKINIINGESEENSELNNGKEKQKNKPSSPKLYYMSPRGTPLNQDKITEISSHRNIGLLCGRYDGVDQRIIDEYAVEEISLGDFVIMGGELAALALVEGLVRRVNGVINEKSIEEDSFGGGGNSCYRNLLEYPIYTLPRIWKQRKVPDVLLSGNHEAIEKWKLQEAEKITKIRRPDLYEKYLEEMGKNMENR